MIKKLLIIAMVTIAIGCHAVPLIPTVGATQPSGEGNDGAPGCVFHLCKRTSQAVRINTDGSLSYFSITDYIEVYASPYYHDFTFNGMMSGIEPVWVKPDWAENYSMTHYVFDPGTKIGMLSDNSTVHIYPVELSQTCDGEYYFEPQHDYDLWGHPKPFGVFINCHVKGGLDDANPLPADYPHDFFLEIDDKYAFFKVSENGRLEPVDNYMVYRTEIEPVEESTYAPPADASFTQAQLISRAYGSLAGKSSYPQTQGRFVTLATHGDSLYVRNLFPDSGRGWLKGTLEGGKAVFHRGDVSSSRSELKRLAVYDWSVEGEKFEKKLVLTPVDGDLTFDYDAMEKTLSNPSAAFYQATDVGQTVSMPLVDMRYSKPSVFIDAAVSPWEDVPLTPPNPRFTATEWVDGDYAYNSDYMLSDISVEGMLMDSSKLYYRILYNDGIPIEVALRDEDGNEYVTGDIPYNYNCDSYGQGPDIRQEGDTWRIYYFGKESAIEASIQLFYDGGGETRASGIDCISSPNSIEEVAAPEAESSVIYDLQGRRVDPDLIAPGIYIRNGRKFVKR